MISDKFLLEKDLFKHKKKREKFEKTKEKFVILEQTASEAAAATVRGRSVWATRNPPAKQNAGLTDLGQQFTEK